MEEFKSSSLSTGVVVMSESSAEEASPVNSSVSGWHSILQKFPRQPKGAGSMLSLVNSKCAF